MGDYAAACLSQLHREQPGPATSLFFGGGTPSLLPGSLLRRLVEAVPLAAGAEVTVECNPESVNEELLGHYALAGVNRLSFGVQSMVPAVLASLGREHDPASVRRAVRMAAEAGLAGNYSVDLIYGAAGETLEDWRRSLEAVLSLDPPPAHVSAYALTVEAGTPLARAPSRHPDDDDQADKYELADDLLDAAGFSWYELSNWARPDHRCRHNLLYWEQGDYLGIGCAAHSHRRGHRWWNVRTPERYIALCREGAEPTAGDERLGPDARRLEALQLQLRTASGVPADAFEDDERLDGLVRRSGGRAVLTRRGRLLANEVATLLRLPG